MQWSVVGVIWTLVVSGAVSLPSATQANKTNASLTSQCCDRLLATLGANLVLLPDNGLFNVSTSGYWASQELENRPRCVVVAQSTRDVSTAVRTLTNCNNGTGIPPTSSCPFAIKAGGHGKWSASSLANGVVLDLSAIKTIQLSTDKQSVVVGAGAKWSDVYATLNSTGVTVAGGRDAGVGVGGLSLAGGLNFFTPRIGLTANTLLDVEMVLANGKIVHTSWQRYHDLNKAIRGGTNNFGVATRFTFRTVPFSSAYGGNVFYALDTAETQLRTIQSFAADPQYDPYATITLSFGASSAGAAAVVNMVHTAPGTSVPAKLQPFANITSLFNTLRPVSMVDISEETSRGSPAGLRQATYTLTLHNDFPTMLAAYALWNASYPTLIDIPGISFSFTLEPLPTAALAKTGNDITGLSSNTTAPLLIYLVSATWLNAADDNLVLSTASKLLNDVRDRAKQLGTLHPFVYAGYADKSQDVFASIGSENYAFARKVSRIVDPKQIFQKQVLGGFKLVNSKAFM